MYYYTKFEKNHQVMKELEGFKFSSRIEVSDELANKLAVIPNQSRAPIFDFYYAAAAIVLLISINSN